MSADLLIVFLKAPRWGTVKTRLAHTLGSVAALLAYELLVRTLLRNLQNLETVELRFTPDEAATEIEPWRAPRWQSVPQGEGDLGQRLTRAFDDAFASGSSRVVVIGSDCPDVSVRDIEAAWRALALDDVALGPATDGGYWLIGLRAPQPALFQGIDWSTSQVLEQTLTRARQSGRRVHLLRELTDVDTEAEWRQWLRRQRDAR